MFEPEPNVTIGFLPKQRFALSAKVLKQILQYTTVPFKLIIIDCNIPKRYINEMKKVVQDHPYVDFLTVETFLQPNESRNLIIKNTSTEYLCLLESDSYVSENWLHLLLNAINMYDADIAVPLLYEGPKWRNYVHFDQRLGKIHKIEHNGTTLREFRPIASLQDWNKLKEPVFMDSLETHCVLYKTDVFEKIGLFDSLLSTREPVDHSLAIHESGATIIMEPKSKVYFQPLPRLNKDELPFYKFAWDRERAAASNEKVKARWNIQNMPDTAGFVNAQHHRTTYFKWWLYLSTNFVKKKVKKIFKKKT